MFSSEPRKSQIVPVLPAASREAGRTVTSAEVAQTPSQKKSGMVSAVRPAVVNSGLRPAVSSGLRPAVGSGLHPAMSNSAAATVLLPRVDYPEKRMDMKTVALWLMGGLLVLNLAVTAILLLNLDRSSPEEVEQRAKLSILQEEVARLKAESEKNFNHASRVYNQLQLDSDMMRGQLQAINQSAVDRQRATGKSPHDTPSAE